MTNKIIKRVALFFLGMSLSTAYAQQATVSTGGDAYGAGGTAAFSIGQVLYMSSSGTTGLLIQGVEQPYEISEVSGINENSGITLSATAYPNPTTDWITLEIKYHGIDFFNYLLLDTKGELIKSKKITENQTNIDLKNIAAGIYFLKVVKNNNEVKIFKIIKN